MWVTGVQTCALPISTTKKIGARLHIGLNWSACPCDGSSPVQHDEAHVDPEPDVFEKTMSQPLLNQPLSVILSDQYDRHDLDTKCDESESDEIEGYLHKMLGMWMLISLKRTWTTTAHTRDHMHGTARTKARTKKLMRIE